MNPVFAVSFSVSVDKRNKKILKQVCKDTPQRCRKIKTTQFIGLNAISHTQAYKNIEKFFIQISFVCWNFMIIKMVQQSVSVTFMLEYENGRVKSKEEKKKENDKKDKKKEDKKKNLKRKNKKIERKKEMIEKKE